MGCSVPGDEVREVIRKILGGYSVAGAFGIAGEDLVSVLILDIKLEKG